MFLGEFLRQEESIELIKNSLINLVYLIGQSVAEDRFKEFIKSSTCLEIILPKPETSKKNHVNSTKVNKNIQTDF